jgi:hypothetical protein
MDGIISLFLDLLVALATVSIAAVGRRRSCGVNAIPRQCASCQTLLSMRRISGVKSRLFWAGWECPHCGTRSRSKRRAAGTVP